MLRYDQWSFVLSRSQRGEELPQNQFLILCDTKCKYPFLLQFRTTKPKIALQYSDNKDRIAYQTKPSYVYEPELSTGNVYTDTTVNVNFIVLVRIGWLFFSHIFFIFSNSTYYQLCAIISWKI